MIIVNENSRVEIGEGGAIFSKIAPAASYVTDGLVQFWDPSNLSSYPGSGDVIYDISPVGTNHGYFIGNVAYSATWGGVLELDGKQLITGGTNLFSSAWTLFGASRYTTLSFVEGATRTFAALNNNFLVGHWEAGCENFYVEPSMPDSKLYSNNVYIGTGVLLSSVPSDTNWRIYGALASNYGPNIIRFGSRLGDPSLYNSGDIQYSNSQMGFLMLYNRILTEEEMTQNYDYFKTRYVS